MQQLLIDYGLQKHQQVLALLLGEGKALNKATFERIVAAYPSMMSAPAAQAKTPLAAETEPASGLERGAEAQRLCLAVICEQRQFCWLRPFILNRRDA